MSADKHKAIVRQLLILRKCNLTSIMLNHEGGTSSENSDIVKMIELGYLTRPAKQSPPKKFYKEFVRHYRLDSTYPSLHGHAPRLYTRVTDKGRKFFLDNKHRIKLEHVKRIKGEPSKFVHSCELHSWNNSFRPSSVYKGMC